MAITYYMVQIPPILLFILLILFGASFAGLATFIFRKYARLKILRSHNEVTGFLFLAIGSFYSLLLSFIVLVVWDQLNETHSTASKEGSAAMGLYRDIKYYPDSVASKQLMTVYLDFVFNVIDEEFPNMEKMKQSRRTPVSFNKVFYTMERLKPKNAFQVQLVGQMFDHLRELSTLRGLRTTSLETEIPAPLWFPLILGALITLGCSMLLDIEHQRMHIVLNSFLGAFIAMLLFIIILLDHPYTGYLGVKPKAYKEIFTMEQWANVAYKK